MILGQRHEQHKQLSKDTLSPSAMPPARLGAQPALELADVGQQSEGLVDISGALQPENNLRLVGTDTSVRARRLRVANVRVG